MGTLDTGPSLTPYVTYSSFITCGLILNYFAMFLQTSDCVKGLLFACLYLMFFAENFLKYIIKKKYPVCST